MGTDYFFFILFNLLTFTLDDVEDTLKIIYGTYESAKKNIVLDL